MDIDNQLFNELLSLRSKLQGNGRPGLSRVTVCPYEAICQMAKLRPRKLSDFKSIPKIGKTFIDNYAELFLDVIQKYDETHNETNVDLNAVAIQNLKELEKKLVNVNRRNRLLYLPKAINKYAVDLYLSGTDPLKIIFGKRPIMVSDVSSSCSTK